MYGREIGIRASVGTIDDATWRDLDMGDVFHRMNTTGSFAGERYLYARIRSLSGEEEVFRDYERQMEYFSENEEERTFIQYQLARIGKHPSRRYYLPVFSRNLDAFGIAHVWLYRVMQVLLIGALAAALLIRFKEIFMAAAAIFLVNIVISAIVKNKYETHLEVVKGIYAMMQAGKKIVRRKHGGYGAAFPELEKLLQSLKKSDKYFRTVIGRSDATTTGDAMEIVGTYITGASYRQSLPGYCLPEFAKGLSVCMEDIKSLKRITDGAAESLPALCVVDEILRGTNTKERIAASAAILRFLNDKNCIVLVATHDMELLELLKGSGYEYYYFTEHPENEDVLFDYIIRRGVSDRTNAIRLLEQMGFPEEVVTDSKKICGEIM